MVRATTTARLAELRRAVWRYYARKRRVFPWRPPELRLRRDGTAQSPYHILVSEVMLQQTQAGPRTVEKYRAFIQRFPTTAALSRASVSDVYRLWQGLGYNRRAPALRDAARHIEKTWGGQLPRTQEELRALPGVGPYTAAAVMVFAYNEPAVLIETNVRTALIHHLFPRRKRVSDAELRPLVERLTDVRRPRAWYAALMDYGAALKKREGNSAQRSEHYVRQKPFAGSARQVRGRLLRELLARPRQSTRALSEKLEIPRERVEEQAEALCREGLIAVDRGRFALAG